MGEADAGQGALAWAPWRGRLGGGRGRRGQGAGPPGPPRSHVEPSFMNFHIHYVRNK